MMTEAERAVYAGRRERVLAQLGDEGVLVLPAAPELVASRDTELRYRPDADLVYLTGYTEPEAVLVLAPGAPAPFTLFVRPRDPERELWTGRRGGVEAARDDFGADEALPVSELGARLAGLLAGRATLYARLDSGRAEVDALVRETVLRGRAARQRSGRGARALLDPGALLDELRLFKDAHELALMRQAAAVSVQAFRECAAAIRPGAGEWEVQAALEHGFRRQGADGPAFESIIASGENATVLHYVSNDRRLQAGELVLVDAGAAWRGYAADITRTFPVSGQFTGQQRALYEIVLAAHQAGIAAARPGAPSDAVHDAALRVLVEGMVQQGLLQGAVEELLAQEQGGYRGFYPHKTSHWLGLDVHDVGDYARGGASRRLEAGMVLTVEPGLYLPAGGELAHALRGTGIRIEDDVLITAEGAENLTGALPVAPAEVEALVGR